MAEWVRIEVTDTQTKHSGDTVLYQCLFKSEPRNCEEQQREKKKKTLHILAERNS